jgi:N-acetylglutamate synthase-like GNAT family acetyltransferase
MIAGGVPAVNVCAAKELEQELFTYAGAGIFFTRDRYADVRPLALDEFDAASDLMVRGEADGYLVPRNEASRDAILAHGVGVFIEGRYLAGIGAILPYVEERAAEIAALYALTRYAGEGAGSHIVRFAIERARSEGLAYLFACTTSDRVERFFERHGFARVPPEALPATKWRDYASERRGRVRCLRLDL